MLGTSNKLVGGYGDEKRMKRKVDGFEKKKKVEKFCAKKKSELWQRKKKKLNY